MGYAGSEGDGGGYVGGTLAVTAGQSVLVAVGSRGTNGGGYSPLQPYAVGGGYPSVAYAGVTVLIAGGEGGGSSNIHASVSSPVWAPAVGNLPGNRTDPLRCVAGSVDGDAGRVVLQFR